MKLQFILVALVIGVVGFAAPSLAQRGGRGSSGGGYGPLGIPSSGTDTAGNKYADYLYGVVKELNKDSMVLTKTKVGPDQTFKFNKNTKFIHDGKNSSFESLKVGDEVWVDADEDKKTGDFTARKVVTGVFAMPSS